MKKTTKFISIILILTIIINILTSIIIQNKSNAVTQNISTEINKIDEEKYPGIKEKIETLKTKYPKWTFKLLYTGLDWNEVIKNEYVGHGSSPKNLIYKSSNYQGEWICSICGDKGYDNGNWKCASEQAIKYMMDPRNSLNESDIFQFEELTKSACDIEVIKSMTKETFLEGHEQGIIDAATNNNINPYYIVARLIQEQGKTGTVLTEGKGYNGQYPGYYNAFNIAASGNSTAEILTNALAYAKKKEWTTLDKSIDGGISFLAKQYIKKGQSTLYLQKFDVEATNGLYSNQYMQNILAAQKEGETLRNTYIKMNSMSSSHTFIIPVYENMPKDTCSRPDVNGTSTTEKDMVKVNVDETLRIRNNPNGDKTVGWLYKDEIVTRLKKATSRVGGTYWDKIEKSDGTVGYTARETYEDEGKYKLYLVPINDNKDETNKENTPNNGQENEDSNSNNNQDNTKPDNKPNIENSNNNEAEKLPQNTKKVKMSEDKKVIIVSPDAIAKDILDAFGGPTKITRANGDFLSGEPESLSTGYIVEDKYTVVKLGDCNGDGKVNSSDALQILKYSVGNIKLDEKNQKAANANKDGKVNSSDALLILKYSVGNAKIEL